MKILQITDIFNPKGNGVAVAVNYYTKYEQINNSVALFNLNARIDTSCKYTYEYNKYNSISSLPDGFNKPDIVVFNEVYKIKYIKLYKECLKNDIPFVIIPHGCLAKNAQKKKHFKKAIGNILFFNNFIRSANAVQYLNTEERDNSIYSGQNYIISGNGVEVPMYKNKSTNSDLVYIGRYNIDHKGLDIILDICDKYRDWFVSNNIKVKLYGRSSGNDLIILKKMVSELNIKDIVEINDAVYAKEKEKVLKNAYAFIQPSRYEGQPMGIIEALSIGLPCIITYQTNFGEYVNQNKCGIGVNNDIKTIFEAIRKIYDDKAYRNILSENAIKYVIRDFKWDKVIDDLLYEYDKIIERSGE